MKYYETELPAGYAPALVIDATSKRLGILLNVWALVISAAIIIPAWLLIRPDFQDFSLLADAVLLVSMPVYLVLHELIHGAAYWVMTHRKLTFGLTATVAYCGVPDIFTYRKTAMIALLAPFVFFIPVFSLPLFWLTNDWSRLNCAFLLGLHIGGCIGDLYNLWLFLTRFRDPETLMQDTGPKQTFYIHES